MNFPSFNNASDQIDSSVISIVNFVVLTYFPEYYTTCVIKTAPDYVLLREPIPTVVITIDQNFSETLQSAVDNGCQAFVVSERALFEFLDLFIIVHDASDQRSASKKLLAVFDTPIELTVLDEISRHPNILELRDILIISPSRNHGSNVSLELLTTKISNNGTRSTVNVEFETVIAPDYYPDKSTNMNKVPIHFYSLMYPPYVYYEESEPGKANARYRATFKEEDILLFLDGTEGTLLVEFCRRYNCTVEASFDELHLWGEVFDNHTGNGLIGAVVERRADIAMAAIYFWGQPYKFGTYTQAISRSGITVLVPKPRMLPPWRTPFLSFSGDLWIAVLVAFCVGVVAVWLIEKVRYVILLPPNELPITISDSMLTMIGFYMEQSARMRTDMMSCVLLFTSLLFAGFMVGNSYGGGLAGVMTIPQYEKPIDTTVDLADRGLEWGATALSWIFSILTADEPYMKTLVRNYHVVSNEYLAKRSKTHDMGFAGERTEFHHFVPSEFIDNEASAELQLLKDDLYWESCLALVTKTCPFKQKLNDLIMLVKQSGIQNYWEMQAAYLYLHATVQQNIVNARQTGSGDDVIKLTVSHFLGAYLILACGLGMAFLAFLLESSQSRLIRTIHELKAKIMGRI